MIISIIVAMDLQNGIGIENRIPWRLSTDLKRFRELTMGHHLIVGRRTFDSIGRPLPGRRMIVLTRQTDQPNVGNQIARSLPEALEMARQAGESEAFIGGGAEIYRLALPLADRLYLTRVATTAPADTFFPHWDPAEWVESVVSSQSADERNEFETTFLVYERRR
ncbi:MAG: dihydrofolate reductase [Acidobacteriota bacterium]